MNNSQSIDILPFVAEAMSTNYKIYKSIDALYNTNPIVFHDIGKQHSFYNHHMATEGNLEQEYYFKKSLSILSSINSPEINNKEDLENKLIDILEKGWKYSTTYAKNHKKIVVTDFMQKYVRKYKGLDNISDNDLNSAILIMVVVANTYRVEIDSTDSFYNVFITHLTQRLNHCNGDNRISLDKESSSSKSNLRDLELKMLNRNKYLYLPLGKVITNSNLQEIPIGDKFLIAFDYVYDLEKLSLVGMVGDTFLTTEDVQEIILAYTCLFRENDTIDIDELEKFVYAASQIRYLCKEYKKAKEFFFKNHQERLYNDIAALTAEIETITTLNTKLINDNSILDGENKRLSIYNKRLVADLEKANIYNKELISLRDHIFTATNEDDYIIDETIDVSLINNVDGIIIGGSPSWQLKMKKELHKWIFISVDSLNFDKNLLNKDYVFVNTSYLSHAMYYKVIENLGPNTHLSYINKNNIDICLSNISHVVKMNIKEKGVK
ncbi:MAG: hypothetical protein RSA57_03875 [Cetobacterium sp.]|uniref:hypothetical protein n=1 Tax=Bacteria TaxID=2 RepID=UPI002FC7FC9F